MARAPQKTTPPVARIGGEAGATGLKRAGGYLYEEFLPQLRNFKGRETYREMSENDATVGAVLSALNMVIRSVKWDVAPAEGDEINESAAEAEAAFGQSLLDDMSHPFTDFVAEALTMFVYGWSYFEIVYKRRIGPNEADSNKRSDYPDGRIGVKKLAPRAQDTLERWEFQDDGGIEGMYQRPPMTGGLVYLPIEKSLLFRTMARKNSPEGISLLRTAWRTWRLKKNAEDFESIGIERELAGLPVAYIPKEYLDYDNQNVSEETRAARRTISDWYKQLVRDLRYNEQAGVVLPSDVYTDVDGKPSGVQQVKLELLTSGGQRTIDTDKIIRRYASDIARSVLTDFMLMGESGTSARGGYGMHEGKVDLFMLACEAMLDQLAQPINMYLFPRVWALNGLDPALMPVAKPGKPSKIDLEKFAAYISTLANAGAPFFPDDELENFARSLAGIPDKSPDSDAKAIVGPDAQPPAAEPKEEQVA